MPDTPSGNMGVDRDTARSMIADITYVPPLEHTAYALALEQEQKDRKARKAEEKKAKAELRHQLQASGDKADAASVRSASTFGSSVGLLKKVGRKSKQ